MKLFHDASVLLSAAGSSTGSSRALFQYAPRQHWLLLSSPHAINEAERNLPKLSPAAALVWRELQTKLKIAGDVLALVFAASKGRPILFSALASATVLLTLDKADFRDVLGTFYGLRIALPYEFLEQERRVGRLLPS